MKSLLCFLCHAMFVSVPFMSASIAREWDKKERDAAFLFNNIKYFHRFTRDDQLEYTPAGQEDLKAWKDMVTIHCYCKVKDGEGLAATANAVLENYRAANGLVVRTDSVPKTKDQPAEHLIVVVFGRPEFLEVAFARFRMHDGVGTAVIYSHRWYWERDGKDDGVVRNLQGCGQSPRRGPEQNSPGAGYSPLRAPLLEPSPGGEYVRVPGQCIPPDPREHASFAPMPRPTRRRRSPPQRNRDSVVKIRQMLRPTRAVLCGFFDCCLFWPAGIRRMDRVCWIRMCFTFRVARRILLTRKGGMMSALHLDTIGVGIVVVMLGVLMFAVLMQQRQRNAKTISIWLGSLVVGLLLGSALTLGALRLREARYTMPFSAADEFALDPAATSDEPAPSGDMGGGMGGDMGGGMGGPNPRRDLATLVRKLDLLTGDIKMTLTAEQCASVAAALAEIEAAEDLSDDDAQTTHDALLAQLDDGQKSLLDAVGLPRPPRGAGGPGGGPPAPEANPFHQEVNAEALVRLRERLNQ